MRDDARDARASCIAATPITSTVGLGAEAGGEQRAGRAAAGTRAARRRRASARGRRASARSRRRGRSRRRRRRRAASPMTASSDHAAPAPEHAAEHVAAEEVGAERRRRALGRCVRDADRARSGAVRRDERPEERDQQRRARARRAPTVAGCPVRRGSASASRAIARRVTAPSAASARAARRARSATMLIEDVEGARSASRATATSRDVADRDRVDELLARCRGRRTAYSTMTMPPTSHWMCQREHLHGRRERVAQRVARDHAPLGDAVQPRHLRRSPSAAPRPCRRAPSASHVRRASPPSRRQHRQHERRRACESGLSPGGTSATGGSSVEPGEEDERSAACRSRTRAAR